MKIRTKLVLLTSTFMIALTAAVSAATIYSINQDAKEELARLRTETLNNIIEEMRQKIMMATSFIHAELEDNSSTLDSATGNYVKTSAQTAAKVALFYLDQEQKGTLTRAKAQAAALEKIKSLRAQVAINSIFIHNTAAPYPRVIMATDDSNLDDSLLFGEMYNHDGKNMLADSVALAKSKQQGALEIEWAQSDNTIQRKTAYIEYVPKWDWVIGSEQDASDQKAMKLELIKNALRKMRYDDGEGYFWIISDQKPFPTMVMHPRQAYEGALMDSMRYDNLANNGTEHLFTAIVSAANKAEYAYLDTVWPRQIGAGEFTKPLPKPTYIAHIKELGWIVGTGVWADNIDSIVQKRTSEIIAHREQIVTRIVVVAAVILILAIVFSFIFAKRISAALSSLTNITQAISLGGDLNTKIKEAERKDEIGELAKAIVRLQNSVKLMMNRIRKRQS